MAETLTAKTADKHVLYQLAVQAPADDCGFLARQFRRHAGRPLRVLREDFCGTALLSCQHVRRHRDNRALGIDLSRATLAWAERHNLAALTAAQRPRVQLVLGDVRAIRSPRADVGVALNFSYSVFKTRADMLAYLRAARDGLAADGMYFLDAWGGSDTQREITDRRRIREDGHRFTYLWEQMSFDPITHRSRCAIHFAFDDDTALRDAFTYDWRLWTLPELQELMAEAGFADVHVLWEGTDPRTNRGNGSYRRARRGDADPAWIAYVVGHNVAR